jgi:hypothetical protein
MNTLKSTPLHSHSVIIYIHTQSSFTFTLSHHLHSHSVIVYIHTQSSFTFTLSHRLQELFSIERTDMQLVEGCKDGQEESLKEQTDYILIYSYIQQDATLFSLFYLETALHVSGGITIQHQERKQLYLQHLVFVTPLLLSAAILADSSNGVTNTRCCRYSCLCS